MEKCDYVFLNMYMGEVVQSLPLLRQYAESKTDFKLFAGEQFIPPEDSYFIFIKQGKLKLCVKKEDDTLFEYVRVLSGSSVKFNHNLSVPGASNQPLIYAMENSIVSNFSKKEIYEFAMQDEHFFEEIMNASTFFSHLVRERLLIIGGLAANIRLLTWLDRLCGCCEPDKNQVYHIPCILTQRQIADLLFIHITTCSKLFSTLEKGMLVSYARGMITVYQRDEIKQIINKAEIL